MKLRITVEGKAYDVDVEVVGDSPSAVPAAAPVVSRPAPAAPAPAPVAYTPPAPAAAPSNGADGERVVKAPIVGTIVQLKVAPGDAVTVNQVLLVMEAMKMETNVASPLAGKVKKICVGAGDAVKAGQVLVEFE